MDVVHAPPFESFYLEHREGVLAELRRLLGRERAEDAFQETFLRALRAYRRLSMRTTSRLGADDREPRRRRPLRRRGLRRPRRSPPPTRAPTMPAR